MEKLSKEFHKYGIAYFNSAQVLDNSNTDKNSYGLYAPILYLYRHSFELLLKAQIIKKIENELAESEIMAFMLLDENGESQKKRLLNCHSIEMLFRCFKFYETKRQTSLLNREVAKRLKKIVPKIEKYDKQSFMFRYPVSKTLAISPNEFEKKPEPYNPDLAPDLSQYNPESDFCIIDNKIYIPTQYSELVKLKDELKPAVEDLLNYFNFS